MTKKDYELIARAVVACRETLIKDQDEPTPTSRAILAVEQYAIDKVTYALAQALALDNAQFRIDVFLDACGTVGLLRLGDDAQGDG